MNVTNLLAVKGRDVATIERTHTLHDAVALLRERGIGALVVASADQRPLGMISERDIVRAIAVDGVGVMERAVEIAMSRDVVTCTEATTVDELMATMTERRIRHVPVVAEGRLVGLVSIGDVVKARVTELEIARRELLDYVNAR
ncbi:MAG: CBS domain-containing protein [Acidimicrobiales bacterium]